MTFQTALGFTLTFFTVQATPAVAALSAGPRRSRSWRSARPSASRRCSG
jgi:hypothetical protein